MKQAQANDPLTGTEIFADDEPAAYLYQLVGDVEFDDPATWDHSDSTVTASGLGDELILETLGGQLEKTTH